MSRLFGGKYWVVNVGDDDPHASRHTDITEAEKDAASRSTKSFHRTAYVRRSSGQKIREYSNGKLVGYLGGQDESWQKT